MENNIKVLVKELLFENQLFMVEYIFTISAPTDELSLKYGFKILKCDIIHKDLSTLSDTNKFIFIKMADEFLGDTENGYILIKDLPAVPQWMAMLYTEVSKFKFKKKDGDK